MPVEIESEIVPYANIGAVAGTPYTPTVTQSGTVTSFTTNTSTYIQLGKLVFAWGRLTVNNAGTAAGANLVSVSLPVTARNATDNIGFGKLFDTSAARIYAFNAIGAGAGVNFQLQPVAAEIDTGGAAVLGTLTFTDALATGDIIDFHVMYLAA